MPRALFTKVFSMASTHSRVTEIEECHSNLVHPALLCGLLVMMKKARMVSSIRFWLTTLLCLIVPYYFILRLNPSSTLNQSLVDGIHTFPK